MIQKLRMNFGSIYLMTGRGSLLEMSGGSCRRVIIQCATKGVRRSTVDSWKSRGNYEKPREDNDNAETQSTPRFAEKKRKKGFNTEFDEIGHRGHGRRSEWNRLECVL